MFSSVSTGGSSAAAAAAAGRYQGRACTVLIGSDFEEDRSELRLVQQINEVKRAMAAGRVVVLVNHDQIYEALYDVLNQRFISRTSAATGKTRRMLRLAIGAKSQVNTSDN